MNKWDINKIVKKSLKRLLIMAIVVIVIIFFTGTLFSKKQIMDNLDYNIVLNEDGSVRITETWDIYISHTNTLFRNFKKSYGNSNNFENITNVTVKDLQTGKNLTEINQEMYHVTTDCYYALFTGINTFEIAWGTGMENKTGKKKYQISYTIPNVINSYKDCQEFYWKLLNSDNSIPVKKVTGIITMPGKVEDKNNLKVWGHGPLNGEINVISNDKIEFVVNNLQTRKMLEVRVVTEDNMFNVNYSKIKNYRYLNTIVDEETNWANASNNSTKKFYSVLITVYVIAILINILQSIKFYKISRRRDDGIIHRNLKYCRDIPRDGISTPSEASYLYFFNKDNDEIMEHQSDIVSATILDLALKKYISLRTEDKSVYVNILKSADGLNEDEKAVYEILEGTHKKEDGEFEISKINTFAKKYYSKYSRCINNMVNEARESIYRQKLVDKANKKAYRKAVNAKSIYSFLILGVQFIIIAFLIGLLPIFNKAYISMFGLGFAYNFIIVALILLPFISTLLIKLKFRSKTQNKIAVLTQEGTEEQEQWKALAKFLKEFSLIKEREVPELAIWEKYLVYATAFGIAEKAIEQMKAKYPEIFVEEYWKEENIQQYQILNFATSNFIYQTGRYSPIHMISSSTNTAYSTALHEIAAHSSSSGRWTVAVVSLAVAGRRPVAVVGMGRKIIKME